MRFIFNKDIELLYGLDYCINRENNNLKQYNTKENNIYLDEFYKIYKERISDDVKIKIKEIGEYHQKAEYILNNKLLSFIDASIFDSWFESVNDIQLKILDEVQSDQYLKDVDLKVLKEFYGMDLGNVTVILSMFISGGFGLYVDHTYCILGVKYSFKLNKYKVTGNLISKIYHEVSHPYLKILLKKNNLKIQKEHLVDDCYSDNYTEELLVRVFEIIFASRIYGNEYIEWAIKEQDKQGFKLVRDYVRLYFDNYDNIKGINDYIELI